MKLILAYGPGLSAELRDFIRAKKLGVDKSIPWGSDFLGRLEPFATSGKLLRGSVLCFSYEMFARRPPDKAAVRAAMALELTHSAMLIHDDVMDNDDKRRGQPSMHRQYQLIAESDNLENAGQFGVNMALSGGDAALFLAFELLGKPQTDRANRLTDAAFYDLFIDQMLTTCVGQMQDVYLEARPGTPTKKAIYDLMGSKTAAYTLALPLAMGAALAGETKATLQNLRRIGIDAGIIFQIRDDELGVLGKTEKTGKPVGSDVKEGKKTLLYYYLTKKCSLAEREKIKRIFGNPDAAAQDIAYVQALAKRHHIPQLLNSEIRLLKEKSAENIDRLPVTERSKSELRGLVAFCARRQF